MNNRILKKSSNEIFFGSCAKFNDEFYGSLHTDGMTFKMDLATGDCSLTGLVSQYMPINSSTAWRGTIAYGRYADYLFLLEITCERLAIYNKKNCTVEYIDINMKYYSDLQFSVSLVTSYNDRLFIFPCFDDQLKIVNMSKKMVENTISLYPNKFYEYKEMECDTIFGNIKYPIALFSQALRVGNDVYLFSHVLQEVIKFSLVTLKIERIPICKNNIYLVDVGYANGKFYMLDVCGNVYLWQEKRARVELLVTTDHDVEGYYNRVLPTHKNIWLLPCYGNDIRIIDEFTKKSMVYNEYPENFCYQKIDNYRSKYGYGCEDEHRYYLAAYCSNYMLTINKDTGESEWIFPKGLGSGDKKKYLWENGVFSLFVETDDFPLNDYLSHKYKRLDLEDNASLLNGSNIWNVLKCFL